MRKKKAKLSQTTTLTQDTIVVLGGSHGGSVAVIVATVKAVIVFVYSDFCGADDRNGDVDGDGSSDGNGDSAIDDAAAAAFACMRLDGDENTLTRVRIE